MTVSHSFHVQRYGALTPGAYIEGMANARNATYSVIYRTGGTRKFQWNRTLPTRDRAEAVKQMEDIRRMGYEARVVDHETSLSIGLPETHCVSSACSCVKEIA